MEGMGAPKATPADKCYDKAFRSTGDMAAPVPSCGVVRRAQRGATGGTLVRRGASPSTRAALDAQVATRYRQSA